MERKTKKKSRIFMEEHGIPNITEYSNQGLNEIWTFDNFVKDFSIKVVNQSNDERDLEFDIIGCSAALTNAIRRILLSEVPSMAIEKVFINLNTSIMQDEVFSHRLGLLPLRANPKLFEYPAGTIISETEVSDQDTLRYEIKVKCTKNPNAPIDSRKRDDIYLNSKVLSKDVKWVPIGRQRELYPNGHVDFAVLEDDIMLCKMVPGQEIHAFMHAVKGIGKDHAKFSPVATATYRLLPDIQILKPIKGEMAERFKNCFSPGVIELVENKQGVPEAKVKNARYDSCSRNVFNYEDLKDAVKLGRISNHFIFTIESAGGTPSKTLFIDAVNVLKKKCKVLLEELDNIV